MAVDLLERFNPAERAARRRMLTQKWGARANQVFNVLDELEDEHADEDPTVRAAMGR